MSLATRGALCALVIAVPAARSAAQSARKDTVDVVAGSKAVDFSKHTQSTSRAVQTRIVGDQATPMPVVLWKFAFTDTGGRALLHVHSEPEKPGTGPAMPVPAIVLDRKTLALVSIRGGSAPGPHVDLAVNGNTVRGVMALRPDRTDTLNVALAHPPFFQPLVDLIVESLPRTTGVVYRVPLWQPGAPAEDVRLYETVRREDIEVLGTAYKQAYVVTERKADGTPSGTMWIVDRAPFLVRWDITRPDGSMMRLDQQDVR